MFTKETDFVTSRDGQQLKAIEDMQVKRRDQETAGAAGCLES